MYKTIIPLIIFCNSISLYGVTIGSDSAVSRFATQQILNTGDRVASFAALPGGIALNSFATTATFAAVFPVSGQINLKGGTLILDADLVCSNNAQIVSLGNITGQRHLFDFASTSSFLQTATFVSTVTFSNVTVFLNDNTLLRNCRIRFSGDSVLNGNGAILTFDPTSQLSLDANSQLLIKNITLNGIRPNQFYALSATSTYLFDNVIINLDTNYSFTVGRFEILSLLDIQGNGFAFTYQSTATSVVQAGARLMVDQGVTFSYAPSNGNRNLLTFIDPTSQLYINGGILYTSSQGIALLKGTLLADLDAFFINTGATSANGIILGDGVSSSNDMTLKLLPAGTINLNRGFLVYKNV